MYELIKYEVVASERDRKRQDKHIEKVCKKGGKSFPKARLKSRIPNLS